MRSVVIDGTSHEDSNRVDPDLAEHLIDLLTQMERQRVPEVTLTQQILSVADGRRREALRSDAADVQADMHRLGIQKIVLVQSL